MAGLINLPGYNPGNALSFAGINDAIDSNRQNALAQRQMGMQEQRLGFERDRLGMEKQQFDQAQQMATVKRFAGIAQGIDQMTNPLQRTAAWENLIKQHPNAAQLPEIYRDPTQGPKLLMQEAQGFVDPLDKQAKQAQIGMHGAHAELYRAQAMDFRRKAAEPGLAGGFKDPKQLADVEEGLRKEYSSHAKPYFETRDAFSRIQQASSNPSPAGDLALIFNFMKMLDPGSVVREGEFATAQNAAGVPDRIVNVYNRLLSGERLGDKQRGDFVSQAQGLFSRAESQYASTQRQYDELVRRKGMDPRNVILDYGIPKTANRLEPPPAQRGDRQAMPPRVGGGPGAQGMIPPQAVQFLRSNPSPEIIQQFEAKYGPGSARQFMGAQ